MHNIYKRKVVTHKNNPKVLRCIRQWVINANLNNYSIKSWWLVLLVKREIPTKTSINHVFNYKHALYDINIDIFFFTCTSWLHLSTFTIHIRYNSTVHVITGDRNIINNTPLRDILVKPTKYHEHMSIYWKHITKLFIDSVHNYARQSLKEKREEGPLKKRLYCILFIIYLSFFCISSTSIRLRYQDDMSPSPVLSCQIYT